MTINDLHNSISELLYIEDTGMVDIMLASIIANSLKIGDPVWITLIGPSSGGKSQLIRPFAKGNPTLIHRIDDMTGNTMISGSLGLEHSFLGRMGDHGIISMDDLTVLFSKNTEERGQILSQFRMIYDGRYSKSSGNRKEEMDWEGYAGMISGSTPSIYRYFAEVADMGERFVSYRMKQFDKHKAVNFIKGSSLSSQEMDDALAELLGGFITAVMATEKEHLLELSDEVAGAIATISEHATLLRTPVHIDERSGFVDEFPEPEMPFRVMKQLTCLAKALQVVYQAPLLPAQIHTLEWVAWSLSNDKRRAYLRYLVGLEMQGKKLTSRNISSCTGLETSIVKKGLDQLQALDIVRLKDDSAGEKEWSLYNRDLVNIVKRLDPPDIDVVNEVEDI